MVLGTWTETCCSPADVEALILALTPPVWLILPLTRFNNFTNERKNKIKKVLKNINKPFISNDLSEIIEKALI